MAVAGRPLERGEQCAVLGDVVGRGADRLGELLDHRAVLRLDADAEAGRSGIAARAAVDVRDDRPGRSGREGQHYDTGGAPGAVAADAGTGT